MLLTENHTSSLYLFSSLYLVLHLSIYLLILRKNKNFYGERKIFLYHFWSGCLYSIFILGCNLILLEIHSPLLTSAGLISLHGIYSVSFLEIWSLAQGSYSMSVLSGIRDKKNILREDIIYNFSEVGNTKKNNRLAALIQLQLVCKKNNQLLLTLKGKFITYMLLFFHWLPNLKNTG